MPAAAVNNHLQPGTADVVHRQKGKQEAESRWLGTPDQGKPIPGDADKLGNAAGPQLKLMIDMQAGALNKHLQPRDG